MIDLKKIEQRFNNFFVEESEKDFKDFINKRIKALKWWHKISYNKREELAQEYFKIAFFNLNSKQIQSIYESE